MSRSPSGRDAVERGVKCMVISDACAATVTSNHEAAPRTITTEGGIFGAIVPAAHVIRGLQADQSRSTSISARESRAS